MPAPQVQGVAARYHHMNSQHRRVGPQKVFVYGTLKKGYGNHQAYLGDCKELGIATVQGLMFHIGGFPAINLSEQFSRIAGEVYEVTWDQLLHMDRLEGVGRNFYDRIEARVEPHGLVWTYIFPRHRAEKEEWLVPSGVWQGPTTPKVKWAGFGKGVEIGVFQTNSAAEEIKIGAGESPYVLRRSVMDSSYKLTHKETGEVIGSYRHVRDMVGKDGQTKPVLSLRRDPCRPTLEALNKDTPAMTKLVDEAIKETLSTSVIPYSCAPAHIPVNIWTPEARARAEAEAEEENIPQAARLLGLKYGAA